MERLCSSDLDPDPWLMEIFEQALEQNRSLVYVSLLKNCSHLWNRQRLVPHLVSQLVSLDHDQKQTHAVDAFLEGLVQHAAHEERHAWMQELMLNSWNKEPLCSYLHAHPQVQTHQLPRCCIHMIKDLTPHPHSAIHLSSLDWVKPLAQQVAQTITPEEMMWMLRVLSTALADPLFKDRPQLFKDVYCDKKAFLDHWMEVCAKKDESWWQAYHQKWDKERFSMFIQDQFPEWVAWSEKQWLLQKTTLPPSAKPRKM